MSDTHTQPATAAHSTPAQGAAPSLSGRSNAELQALDRRVMWHPFTQQRGWDTEDFPVIVAAEGCELIDADGRRYLDGVSSLWCALHGHRVPEIDAAVQAQLGRVAHSTLLGLGGEPAVLLAEQLLDVAPTGLSRVFYSDSGSSAVEIAVKMAFQARRQADPKGTQRTRFLCMQNAYHGDTLGAVSVGGIDLFHEIFSPLLFHTEQVNVPAGHSAALRAADMPRCLAALDTLLAERGDEFAALIMEPGAQGASGLRVYPDGFTRAVVERCRAAGLLVILDEVATGFGRSGRLFACEREGVTPDLLCLAKGLSGGYLPLAATLCSESIYECFLGNYEEYKSFFHGHTFTGNALACAAALASLELCRRPDFLSRARRIEAQLAEGFAVLDKHPNVLEVRRYGSMFGIELVRARTGGERSTDQASGGEGGTKDRGAGEHRDARTGDAPLFFDTARRTGHRVTEAARQRGVILRPLGDTVICMPPITMSVEQCARLVKVALESIDVAVAE
ncbi:MAG: adenosylmethionine-8-amino-7-oxononanoate aminotransferase [Planctomycetota bacterium]|nr:MAG: adenosylmethionine-8-amino-7-oxononanoate aminotransferase [Planctomycetota bacterium]